MKNIDEIEKFAKTAERLNNMLVKISQYILQADESMGRIAEKSEEIDAELIFGEYSDKVEEISKKADTLLSHFADNPDKLAESLKKVEECEMQSIRILESLDEFDKRAKDINELYEKVRQ